jgi:hypothetical protein
MSKIKPVYVYLKETRHKTQPWTFIIDRPGPQNKETKAERYATAWSAKRGAIRKLGAYTFGTTLGGENFWVMTAKKKLYPVKFIYQRLPKKVK